MKKKFDAKKYYLKLVSLNGREPPEGLWVLSVSMYDLLFFHRDDDGLHLSGHGPGIKKLKKAWKTWLKIDFDWEDIQWPKCVIDGFIEWYFTSEKALKRRRA
ncbi:MAG: hypothetical protein A2Z21_02015 [Candidatus Fraserbacteria bacterium RBG_16_55_9]|uniref:Uncharacterized protein n=1 Tax=Fraserbacteria sp. (strain RBG_16_55_9) TaxID=1817864 RepID=A0A1F5UP72_FRAXR|nr:MAG: hypothetical protein A2Z21_02015 [Candidatus Fraserbacteria bacterium RBG_16_55_9]